MNPWTIAIIFSLDAFHSGFARVGPLSGHAAHV